jgi:hypothetical protein
MSLRAWHHDIYVPSAIYAPSAEMGRTLLTVPDTMTAAMTSCSQADEGFTVEPRRMDSQ